MKSYKVFLFLFSLTMLFSCSATKTKFKNVNYDFPNDWLGTYTGTMQWYKGSEKKADIPITIEIIATKDSNSLVWRTSYDSTKLIPVKVVKDYKIVWNDSLEKGHFLMDEQNGIFLDMRLIDNTIYSCFDVLNQAKAKTNRLVSIDRLLTKNVLYHEVISYQEPENKTGNEGQSEGFTVKSTQKVSTQKATLKRVK